MASTLEAPIHAMEMCSNDRPMTVMMPALMNTLVISLGLVTPTARIDWMNTPPNTSAAKASMVK